MNEDLIRELQQLQSEKCGLNEKSKWLAIEQLLSQTTFELRGKSHPDLQLSASALVFVGQKLIFIEHPYQKEWLLPAGHVELGESPLAAAMREFQEETGGTVKAASARLVGVNRIAIPENLLKQEKAHEHVDFRYLLQLATPPNLQLAELPVVLLDEKQAPAEFKKYFQFLGKN